jgi:hypothetical protein
VSTNALKWLIDVAHAHLEFEEVNKVLVFHGGGAMVVPLGMSRWTMLQDLESPGVDLSPLGFRTYR